jgi:hypothetical protein
MTSLVVALLMALASFLIAAHWLHSLPWTGRAIGVVLLSVLSVLAYGSVLHVVVNWNYPSSGFGGIWIDPTWLSKLAPVLGGVVGALAGFRWAGWRDRDRSAA